MCTLALHRWETMLWMVALAHRQRLINWGANGACHECGAVHKAISKPSAGMLGGRHALGLCDAQMRAVVGGQDAFRARNKADRATSVTTTAVGLAMASSPLDHTRHIIQADAIANLLLDCL